MAPNSRKRPYSMSSTSTGIQADPEVSASTDAAARFEAPPKYLSWRKLSWETKINQIFHTLLEWFDVDLNKPNVLKYLDHNMGKSYMDFRTKVLKSIFNEHGASEAPRHKPDCIEDQDWIFLCELWSSEEHENKCQANVENRCHLRFNHRGGSKSFSKYHAEHSESSMGEVQSFPDFFRLTHYSEKKKWIIEEAKRCYNEMVEVQRQAQETGFDPLPNEELSQLVFKNQTTYNVGLGTRKKPTLSRQTIVYSPTLLHIQELNNIKEELKNTKEELKNTKEELKNTKEELKETQETLQRFKEDSQKRIQELDQRMRTFRQILKASLGQIKSQKFKLRREGT